MNRNRDYKSESIREFNDAADAYDQQSPFYYRMTRRCDAAVTARIAALPQQPSRILDVGCGTGALLEKLRSEFPNAELHGVDISPKMLAIAQKRTIPNAAFVEGDAENLPYQDGTFDVVLCCSSFHHYPNPAIAVAEFRRVTRPGGTLMICDMELPAIARHLANHVLFPLQKKGDVHVYTSHEIRKLMTNQGWSLCRVDRITPVEWLAIGMAPKQ